MRPARLFVHSNQWMVYLVAAHLFFFLGAISRGGFPARYLIGNTMAMAVLYIAHYALVRMQIWKDDSRSYLYSLHLFSLNPLVGWLTGSRELADVHLILLLVAAGLDLHWPRLIFHVTAFLGLLGGSFLLFPDTFSAGGRGWMTVLLLAVGALFLLVCARFRQSLAEMRRQRDENLEKLAQQQHLAIIGQIAASIAHDIRNPLTSIKGFVQLIEKNERRSTYQEYYGIIGSEIRRIDTLLREVLMLSKSHMARPREGEQVNLPEVLGRIVLLMEPDAIKNNIQIRVHCEQTLVIRGAEEKLQQVFLNILRNAFEAVLANGRIEIRATEEDGFALVRIRDTGPGVPEDKIPSLFTPFYTTKSEGTGLGLPICKAIIEACSGSIQIGNRPEGGAEVSIRLPLSSRRDERKKIGIR